MASPTKARQDAMKRAAADGSYQLLTAEHIFKDYQFSTEQKIALPE